METIAHTTPRSLEVLTEHVRKAAHCQWCGTPAGKHCGIHGRGEHLSRFVRALVDGGITVDEMAAVIGTREVFSGRTIIRTGAR